jgi:hypothetical protein
MTLPEFGEDIPEDVNLTDIAEALEHNHECANDLLIMKLIDWLGTGDYGSVLLMAEAFKGYELGLPDLDGERNRGKFCAMVACNDLQGDGRSRAQIDKPLVRKRADEFRAILDLKKVRSTKEGKKLRGFKWSAEAIEKQLKVGQLTKHDWTCIYQALGLEDIKGNPGNQKKRIRAP